MPAGGTALRSMSTRAVTAARRPAASSSVAPAAPAATITSAAAITLANADSARHAAWCSIASNLAAARPVASTIRRTTCSARSRERDAIATWAPLPASRRATRCPTGPVPPSTTARHTAAVSGASGTCRPTATTAAAAVVLAPDGSTSTPIRTGPKNVDRTCAATASAAATSEPPMKIAVDARSSPPRVNMPPCTSDTTFSTVTPPCRSSTSAPASTATTASNVLGCGSQSSWIRIFFGMAPAFLRRRDRQKPLKGWAAVSLPAIISSTEGLHFIALAIASSVAW